LPDEFGAEIYTVRDLIVRLQEQVCAAPDSAAAERQSWSRILSAQALAGDDEAEVEFSGWGLTFFKSLLVRLLYLLFRVLLRLEATGLENLPRRGAFLICPNHLSYLDPFIVIGVLPYALFKRVFFVGYSAFFQSGIMKLMARLAGIIPVDPDANLLRAMKMGACGLRQGRILCIFPEGGRSFDGELQEFRKGAAILAKETGAPIVPVGIRGTHEVWPRDSRRIRPHKVIVRFGQPLEADSDSYQQDTDRLRDAVAGLMRPA
jgi:long-chain acyl-CoA synthetase